MLRSLFILTGLILLASGQQAEAEEPSALGEACLKAAHFVAQSELGFVESEQSFPELSPPRVQILMAFEGIVVQQLVRCTFTSPQPPFGITQFCINGSCDLAPDRFEELQVLMQRTGY